MNRYILTIDVGIKNLAYCFVVINTIESNIFKKINVIKWNIIDISIEKNKNNKDNKYNTQIANLIKGIDKLYDDITKPFVLNTDINELTYPSNIEIYIENQPVKQNPVMKAIATSIHTCFTKKMLDYKKVNKVDFLNASVKTNKPFVNILLYKIFNEQNIINIYKNTNKINIKENTILYKFYKIHNNLLEYKDLQTEIGKMKYQNKKEFSELIITEFVNYINKNTSNIVNITQFSSSKKKDDFSDTLLYVIYLITK